MNQTSVAFQQQQATALAIYSQVYYAHGQGISNYQLQVPPGAPAQLVEYLVNMLRYHYCPRYPEAHIEVSPDLSTINVNLRPLIDTRPILQ